MSRDPLWATALRSRVDPARARPTDEHLVAVAPPVTLAGIVHGSDGAPAADAEVSIEIPLSFLGRFRTTLEFVERASYAARTGADGRFSIEGAPALDPGADAVELVGEVHHADGSLAAGALVCLGGFRAWTDEHGLFELRAAATTRGGFGDGLWARRLVATVPGELPAVLDPEITTDRHELWPPFATLVLGVAVAPGEELVTVRL